MIFTTVLFIVFGNTNVMTNKRLYIIVKHQCEKVLFDFSCYITAN